MSTNRVVTMLTKWPDRRALWEDVRRTEPDLALVAVHRWYKRGSVPPKYWAAILSAAEARGITLTAEEIVRAHGSVRRAS